VIPGVEEAAAENFRIHAAWASERLAGAFVERSEDLTIVDCGLDADTFNLVCAARLASGQENRAIRRALGRFRDTGRAFSWWVSPGDRPGDLGRRLVAAGLVPGGWELAMAVGLRSLERPDRSAPPISIRRVRTRDEFAEFARITAENWSPPDRIVQSHYMRCTEILLAPDCPQRFYVALRHGQAPAAVELTMTGSVAGAYGLSTRAEYRGLGIGGALLTAALREAARDGVTGAVLQAAPLAAGLYRRLGFEEFGRIEEFKPAQAPSL
jgi:ribosomal protein S18 acetylase RimI-like enzyme